MKRRNIALTLMASFCLSGMVGLSEARADNPFERLIPRGKLFKKLKNEIAGEDPKIVLPDPRRGIQSRSHAAPTPATQTGYASGAIQQRDMPLNHPSTVTRPLPPIAAGQTTGTASAVTATPKRKPGFGMMVKMTPNNQMVVTGVQQNGNAARAGIRSGDQLLSVGGGKLSGMQEFKQIAKTLGQGDQVEVEFARRGKKQKSLLQFGVAPQEGQVVVSERSTPQTIQRVTGSPNFDTDMDAGMLSVLDSPVEHVSRLEPAMGRPAAPANASTGKITSLNQTIEQQQMKMEAMNEELKLLRKAHQPAVEPTENNWTFPDIGGPAAK